MRVFKYKLETYGEEIRNIVSLPLFEKNVVKSLIFTSRILDIYAYRIYTIKGWDEVFSTKYLSFVRKINGIPVNSSVDININTWIFERIVKIKRALFYKHLLLFENSKLKIELTKNTTTNESDNYINQIVYTVKDKNMDFQIDKIGYSKYCGEKIN